MRLVAHVASIIFHPVLLTSYAAFILIFANTNTFKFLDVGPDMLILRVILNTLFLPGIALLLLKGLGFIKSLTLYDRTDRTIPYIVGMFFYSWTTVSFFMDAGIPASLRVLMLGVSISLGLCFFTNILVMKISLHTSGVGAFMIYMLLLAKISEKNITFFLIVSILAAGLVGSSRLILKAHTRDEVYAGYLAGMVSMLIAFRFV